VKRTAFAAIVWLAVTDAVTQMRRGRFISLTVLCCGLSAVSVYMGVQDLKDRRLETASLAASRPSQTGVLFGRQLEPALREIREPAGLSVLVRGMESVVPLVWDFSPTGVQSDLPSASLQARTTATPLDLEFLVRVVLSLLAVLTAADGLAGERASGALRALRSQPIAPAAVIASKILTGLIAMTAATAMTLVSAAAVTAVAAPELLDRGLLSGSVGLLVAAVAYTMVFFLIGLHVSVSTGRLQFPVTASLIIWVVLTLALPALKDLGESRQPRMRALQSHTDRQRDLDAHLRETRMEIGAALVDIAGRQRDWDAVLAMPAARSRIEDIWARRTAAWRATNVYPLPGAREGEPGGRWLGILSPASALSAAMTRSVGTGLPLLTRWEAATESRQRELNRLLFDDPPRVNATIPVAAGGDQLSYVRHEPVPALSMPPLQVRAEGNVERLRAAAEPIVQLWMVAFVFAGALVWRFARVA
jgi:hypothetical protein